MSTSYWLLQINNVTPEVEDQLTGLLFELGASGVQEDLAFTQGGDRFIPVVVPTNEKSLSVYFAEQPDKSVGQLLRQNFPRLHWQVTKQESMDWQSEWKKSWQSFPLTADCWIVPTWLREEFVPAGEKIFIDPGMAFGTGTHATTQLAAQLIDELCRDTVVSKAVDVGTGSGILAILLEKKSGAQIYAYDNDPEAQRVFAENLAINDCHRIEWLAAWSHHGPYDLVVANIIDGVLVDLKPDFFRAIGENGHLIFTGILLERELQFLAAMTGDWNLELLQRVVKDEWVGFLFKVPT